MRHASLLLVTLCIASLELCAATEVKQSFLSESIAGMSEEQADTFMLGRSFFSKPWVEAPSATTARDGLGPLFSANTCTSCHTHLGAGSVYNKEGEISRSLVTRFSLRGQKDSKIGFVPDPVYGAQLSINGVKDVPYEGKPTLRYETVVERYADGTTVHLQKPIFGVTDLNYGALSADTAIAHRIAPALVGLGWIEKIPQSAILENEKMAKKDGIKGRANWVYNPETNQTELGRFNWKASAASIKHQSAAALSNDMGITSPLYPHENCTPSQKECNEVPHGRDAFDAPMVRLDAIAFYLSQTKMPPLAIKQKVGEKLFDEIGCATCHVRSYTLENGVKVSPFSDFLLHDLGEGLSDDGRSEFEAMPAEWRTQPLWSIGKRIHVLHQKNFLHDGRARNLEEAILWHGGEAQSVKEHFKALPKEKRKALIEFLEEL